MVPNQKDYLGVGPCLRPESQIGSNGAWSISESTSRKLSEPARYLTTLQMGYRQQFKNRLPYSGFLDERGGECLTNNAAVH
jgi:hypothetical protein